MTEDTGVWVYAISECGSGLGGAGLGGAGLGGAGLGGAGLGGAGLGGVGGGAVRAVQVAGLTAIVSDVDLAEFGEAALRAKLEDLAWLERTARAHHAVIEAMARVGPLLPMRLATVYSGDASMADAFRALGGQIRASLRRVKGHNEWGVKAYAVAAPAASDDRDDAGSPGLAYLRRRQRELSAGKETWRDAEASARAVHSELASHATRARLHPPQTPELSGSKAPMVLNAAYLLADSRTESFTSAVATLANKHQNLRLGLTGPWPPYSFSGGDDVR